MPPGSSDDEESNDENSPDKEPEDEEPEDNAENENEQYPPENAGEAMEQEEEIAEFYNEGEARDYSHIQPWDGPRSLEWWRHGKSNI